MARKLLGETFDIHGGGLDLVFPHHENEIAQSEAANDKPLARFWMHNGFVRVDNEKMSKSLGNFFTIREVLAKYDAETVRFFLVRTHYRSALNYSDVHLDDARAALRRLYAVLAAVLPDRSKKIDWSNPYAERFRMAMNNDFGTPEAIAILFELAREINRTQSTGPHVPTELSTLLKNLGECLGLLQHDNPRGFLSPGPQTPGAHRDIQRQIDARTAAKAAKNFAEADRIRQDLLGRGIVLEDSPTGITTWKSKS